jgi:hypothetical protein
VAHGSPITTPLPPGLPLKKPTWLNVAMDAVAVDIVHALMFLILALADVLFIMYLRRRHRRQAGAKRMMKCLVLHVRREISPTAIVVPSKPRWLKAS